VGEAPDARESGGPLGSPVAGVFFLSCGLVTGGFPFSGGVSVRDSSWRPSFFGGPGFLPLGAMVAEGGLRPKEVVVVQTETRGREKDYFAM